METETANMPRRTHHIRYDNWHRMDSRTITIGTLLEKKMEKREGGNAKISDQ